MHFDITALGLEALQKKFEELPTTVERKILLDAMKKAGTEVVLPAVVAATPVLTGLLKEQMARQKIKSYVRKRGFIKLGVPMPRRGQMNIAEDSKWYYPAYVEYGHKNVPAHSYIRAPVNANKQAFFAKVGEVLGSSIEAAAKTV